MSSQVKSQVKSQEGISQNGVYDLIEVNTNDITLSNITANSGGLGSSAYINHRNVKGKFLTKIKEAITPFGASPPFDDSKSKPSA